jgi:SAM-dependent methyltransferase
MTTPDATWAGARVSSPGLGPEGFAVLRRAALRALGERDAPEFPDPALARLGRGLERLSGRLVAPVGAGGHPAYMDDDETRAAYLAGLAPRTLGAAWAELPRLPPGASVLDLGAGTGAAALACVLKGARAVDLVDRSGRALRDAQGLLEEAGASAVRVHAVSLDGPLPGDGHDVVVLAFSLLEACRDDEQLAARLLAAAAARVAPGGHLLVVDSAQRSRARVLNGLRTTLLHAGLHLWSPCPHPLPCPALVRPRDFCHAARPWDLPPDFQRVRAHARLTHDSLTYAFLLAGRAPVPTPPVTARVVGDVLVEKGRARVAVCSASGVRQVVALKRHREAHDALLGLARGTGLALPATAEPDLRVEDAALLRPAATS